MNLVGSKSGVMEIKIDGILHTFYRLVALGGWLQSPEEFVKYIALRGDHFLIKEILSPQEAALCSG